MLISKWNKQALAKHKTSGAGGCNNAPCRSIQAESETEEECNRDPKAKACSIREDERPQTLKKCQQAGSRRRLTAAPDPHHLAKERLSMQKTLESKIARPFSMSDKTWERHANLWSVWTRFTVLRRPPRSSSRPDPHGCLGKLQIV